LEHLVPFYGTPVPPLYYMLFHRKYVCAEERRYVNTERKRGINKKGEGDGRNDKNRKPDKGI
jgi:hypothetical protein